jgi:hypothetical protein
MSVSGNWQALGATGTNGCGSEGGGFGGGSGGAMLLEADTLEVFSPATLRANGGNGGNSQGNGGSGGTSTQTAQPGGNGLANGGGGGGGAVGRIRLRAGTSCTIAGTFSPSPSRSCP